MDERAIGVFDSGLGGLTAVKVLEELLPHENIIYFGDTGRMPYGGREVDELRRMAVEDAAFVSSFGVKAMLVACGTMSAVAMDALREHFDTPFFSVEDAACDAVAASTRNKRVGVIATATSIRSGMFEKGILRRDGSLSVTARACPGWAEMVEQGHFRPGDELAERTVARDLAEMKEKGVDTLLLGCTHYPLLEDIIRAFMGGDVKLISCGGETAVRLAGYLREKGLLSGAQRGQSRYFTSGDTGLFRRGAEAFLGRTVAAEYHSL